MHLGIALVAAVLGRTGRGYSRGINYRALLERQSLGGQRAVGNGQYLQAELVRFEQMAKAPEAHAIRNALGAEEASEVTVQRRLEQTLFHGQIRQAEPLLKDMKTQHGLVCKRQMPRVGYR